MSIGMALKPRRSAIPDAKIIGGIETLARDDCMKYREIHSAVRTNKVCGYKGHDASVTFYVDQSSHSLAGHGSDADLPCAADHTRRRGDGEVLGIAIPKANAYFAMCCRSRTMRHAIVT